MSKENSLIWLVMLIVIATGLWVLFGNMTVYAHSVKDRNHHHKPKRNIIIVQPGGGGERVDYFRCQSGALASPGKYMYWVKKKCGEPTHKVSNPHRPGNAIWTYDLGPGRYAYILSFGATRLYKIEVDRSFK